MFDNETILKWEKPPPFIKVERDAWSNGQIASKLWMCEIIEKFIFDEKNPALNTWIFGSWYALLAFLLLSRERVKIKEFHLFDMDQEALRVSHVLLENWIAQGFPIICHPIDCNQLTGKESFFSSPPNLVINSACEHFSSNQWLENLPVKTMVLLQSTNMDHNTHGNRVNSLDQFQKQMNPLIEILWQGEKVFHYSDQSFGRYCLLGRRR